MFTFLCVMIVKSDLRPNLEEVGRDDLLVLLEWLLSCVFIDPVAVVASPAEPTARRQYSETRNVSKQ